MSAVCGACDVKCSESEDVLKCFGQCRRVFHVKCVNAKFPETVKTRGSKKEWFCEDCKKSRGSSTASSKSGESSTAITKDFLVKCLEEFKKEVFQELRGYSEQFKDFAASLEFFAAKMDETNKAMEEIKTQNRQIVEENKSLRRDNVELNRSLHIMETKIRDLEQYSRRDNIEISGIPQTQGENGMDILRDLGRVLGVEVEKNSVVAVHRVPSFNRKRVPAIVARFHTREDRDNLLKKYREKKTVMAQDVNKNFPATRVYVGEHLTPDNKVLLARLKETGKELEVRYVWCKEGRFYARKCEGGKCVRISNLDELKKVQW